MVRCEFLAGAFGVKSRIEMKFDQIPIAVLSHSICETNKTVHSLYVVNVTACLCVVYDSVMQIFKGQD